MRTPRTVIAFLFALAVSSDAVAQGTILLVRHAERADAVSGGSPMMASDPSLSEAGRRRAESLAAVLRDAALTAIYVTEYKRTQETAAPLATALGIAVTTVPAKDTAGLVERLKAARGNVLVVGHSNTVPEIVKALGILPPLTIEDNDFDDLLIVTTAPQPQLLRLHYR
jgi:broad specificity phosphatase PhoE